MARLSSDVLKTTGGRLMTLMFSVVYFAALARLLSVAEMGAVAAFTLLVMVGTLLSSLGLVASAVRRGPELIARGETARADALLGLLVWAPTAAAVLVSAAGAALAGPLAGLLLKDESLWRWAAWAAAAAPFYRLQDSALSLLLVRKDFVRQVRARWIQDIGGRVLVLAAYPAFGLDGYFAALTFGTAASAAYALAAHPVRPGRAALAEWAPETAAYYGYGFFRFATVQADLLLTGVLLRPEALAAYFVARRFYDAGTAVVDSFVEPVLPRLSEGRAAPAEFDRAFAAASRYASFIACAGGFAMAAFSAPLLWLIGGARYLDQWPVLAVLGAAICAYAFSNVATSGAYVIGRARESLFMEAVYGLANAGASALMIGPFGALGAAAAKACSLSAGCLFSLARLSRYRPLQLDPASWRLPVWLVLPAAALCAATAPGPLDWAPRAALGAVGAVGAAAAFGSALRSEDWQRLTGGLLGLRNDRGRAAPESAGERR